MIRAPCPWRMLISPRAWILLLDTSVSDRINGEAFVRFCEVESDKLLSNAIS